MLSCMFGLSARSFGQETVFVSSLYSKEWMCTLWAPRIYGIGTICIRNRNRSPASRILQVTQFGGEQSGAHAGAAWLWQRMLLDRSILADAAVRSRVCGNRACATARPSGGIRAAVAVCGARGSDFAVRAEARHTEERGLPDIVLEEKRVFFCNTVSEM